MIKKNVSTLGNRLLNKNFFFSYLGVGQNFLNEFFFQKCKFFSNQIRNFIIFLSKYIVKIWRIQVCFTPIYTFLRFTRGSNVEKYSIWYFLKLFFVPYPEFFFREMSVLFHYKRFPFSHIFQIHDPLLFFGK